MYANCRIAGQQFKFEAKKCMFTVVTNKTKKVAKVTFDNVLFIGRC